MGTSRDDSRLYPVVISRAPTAATMPPSRARFHPIPAHASRMTMPHTSRSRGLAVAFLLGIVLALTPARATAQSHFEGELGPGSSYEIDVPAAWNGGLVLYAHGLVQADLPLLAPSQQPEYAALRTAML